MIMSTTLVINCCGTHSLLYFYFNFFTLFFTNYIVPMEEMFIEKAHLVQIMSKYVHQANRGEAILSFLSRKLQPLLQPSLQSQYVTENGSTCCIKYLYFRDKKDNIASPLFA